MATTSIGAPGVTFPDATVQSSATTGVPILRVYTSSSTWTKPTGLKAIKVTVVGGGGNGGTNPGSGSASTGGAGGGAAIRLYPAPSLPGPQPYTVGGAAATSSFGAAPITVISATGGGNGATGGTNAIGGVGSSGQLNCQGSSPAGVNGSVGGGGGGSSILGGGGRGSNPVNATSAGGAYGGGGGGGSISSPAGSAGAAGVVIVEEFY